MDQIFQQHGESYFLYLCGSAEGTDRDAWVPQHALGGHYGAVVDMSWGVDGACLQTVSEDQTSRIFTTCNGHWCEVARPQVSLIPNPALISGQRCTRLPNPPAILYCALRILFLATCFTSLLHQVDDGHVLDSVHGCRSMAMTLRAWQCCPAHLHPATRWGPRRRSSACWRRRKPLSRRWHWREAMPRTPPPLGHRYTDDVSLLPAICI